MFHILPGTNASADTTSANFAQLRRSVSKFIINMRAAPNRLGGTGTPPQKIPPPREKGGPGRHNIDRSSFLYVQRARVRVLITQHIDFQRW
jgi:hypothetical protein